MDSPISYLLKTKEKKKEKRDGVECYYQLYIFQIIFSSQLLLSLLLRFSYIFSVFRFFVFTLFMIQESKSIGAEVNWGVRFKDVKDVGNIMGFLFTHFR